MYVFAEEDGFRVKIWRGESMCLLAFDVDEPEDDFVGFAVEYREPDQPSTNFKRLANRLSFEEGPEVHGFRTYPTTRSPLQTFRWVHFPWSVRPGVYDYRITRMHMPSDDDPVRGQSLELSIELGSVTIPGLLDIGFTRNFASSQAFEALKHRLDIDDDTPIIPARAADGLDFAEAKAAIAITGDTNLYEWLGFEAHRLLFNFLQKAIDDEELLLDVLAYDLNEPDLVAGLEALGPRLRIIIDDSAEHGEANSAESVAAERLIATAGEANVTRGHFQNLQHNKVFIAKRLDDGTPVGILGGSTNFSFRGFYIQSNNMFVFHDEAIATLFEDMFESAFTDMASFKASELAADWHQPEIDGLDVQVCFAPHRNSALSLQRVADAITAATSSVFYAVAFLNQIERGPVRAALDEVIDQPVFSYGIVNRSTGMEIIKPSGEVGLVDFAYLRDHAPQPFSTEWSGGGGINVHHKFVVVDFDQPTATVYTGSCNFAPGGEEGNGDHLLQIRDQRIAIAYAIEALRVFDHLNFRNRMQDAGDAAPKMLRLQKPLAIEPADETWFAKYYVPGSQRQRDRVTFSQQ